MYMICFLGSHVFFHLFNSDISLLIFCNKKNYLVHKLSWFQMILHTELFKIVINLKFAHINVKCDKNNTRKKKFDINMTKREWFVYDANYNQLAGSLDRGQSFICSPLFHRLHVNKKKMHTKFWSLFLLVPLSQTSRPVVILVSLLWHWFHFHIDTVNIPYFHVCTYYDWIVYTIVYCKKFAPFDFLASNSLSHMRFNWQKHASMR